MSENGKTAVANGLYSKMARVMGKISRLQKDGTNPHFRYEYVTDGAVYDTVRGHLASEGIAIFASMLDVEQHKFSEKQQHTKARFEFVLADGETGETMTCTWFAEALDSQDKGINKCATAALKYWLLKTFIIPTGDDPDGDGAVPQRKRAATSRRKKTTKPDTPAKPPTPKPEVSAGADGDEPDNKQTEPEEKPRKSWNADGDLIYGLRSQFEISGQEAIDRLTFMQLRGDITLATARAEIVDAFLAFSGLLDECARVEGVKHTKHALNILKSLPLEQIRTNKDALEAVRQYKAEQQDEAEPEAETA